MDFKEIINNLKNLIEEKPVLSLFCKKNRNFEAWVKVEICELIMKYTEDIIPEFKTDPQDKYSPVIDINVDNKNWGVELKTIPTMYRKEDSEVNKRNLDNDIKGVITDIKNMIKYNFLNKAVVFIVYPYDSKFDNNQLKKIEDFLNPLREVHNIIDDYLDFDFKDSKLSGRIYFKILTHRIG